MTPPIRIPKVTPLKHGRAGGNAKRTHADTAPAEADPPSEGLNHSSETLPDHGPRDVGPGGSSSVVTSSSANSYPIEAPAGVRPPTASQPTTRREAPAMAEKPRSPERNYQAEALNRGQRVVGPDEHSGMVANCSAIDNGQQI